MRAEKLSLHNDLISEIEKNPNIKKSIESIIGRKVDKGICVEIALLLSVVHFVNPSSCQNIISSFSEKDRDYKNNLSFIVDALHKSSQDFSSVLKRAIFTEDELSEFDIASLTSSRFLNSEPYILEAGLSLKAKLVDKLKPNCCTLVKMQFLDPSFNHAMLIMTEKSTSQNADFQYQLFDSNFKGKLVTGDRLLRSTLAEMIHPYKTCGKKENTRLIGITFMDITGYFKRNSHLDSIEYIRSLLDNRKSALSSPETDIFCYEFKSQDFCGSSNNPSHPGQSATVQSATVSDTRLPAVCGSIV